MGRRSGYIEEDDKMKLFIELQDQAKRSIAYNYKCRHCLHFKQTSKQIESIVQEIPRYYYYHICDILGQEKIGTDLSCEDFEPNEETLIQYMFDKQEKTQELMYKEMWDKFHE